MFDEFAKYDLIVEATRFEELSIWQQWEDKSRWIENNSGILKTVGCVNDRPVTISLMQSTVNGSKVLWWHATSMLVDYKLIEQWFDDFHKVTTRTDATNCMQYLKRIKE